MSSEPVHATIRLATEQDDAALRELTRQTPMIADISLQIEREPEFGRLVQARGRGEVHVAELDGRIVACLSSSRRLARLADGVAEIGVYADLKVHPDHRRMGLANALLEAVTAREAEREPTVFLVQTAVGNSAVDGVALQFGASKALRPLAVMTSYQLLTMPGIGQPRVDAALRPATEADIPALEELLDAFHERYVLAPSFADGGLRHELARTHMPLDRIRVAERGGQLLAAVAAWEPDALKQTRVIGLPASLRALSATCRALSGLLPVPRLPEVGQLLHFHYLRYPAHRPGEEEALRALIWEAVARARRAHAHFCLLTAADGDPMHEMVRGLPRTTYRYQVGGAVARTEALPDLDALDGRLVYDDACLT